VTLNIVLDIKHCLLPFVVLIYVSFVQVYFVIYSEVYVLFFFLLYFFFHVVIFILLCVSRVLHIIFKLFAFVISAVFVTNVYDLLILF